MLLRNPGKLLSRNQLLTEVWGPGYADATGNLRLYMAQLRRKLEPDPARPRWLITEPGMGYRYQPSPEPDRSRPGGRVTGRLTRDWLTRERAGRPGSGCRWGRRWGW